MKTASAFAPAKINLFLHVGAGAPDGYHPLTSWMVFADVGDTLSIEPAPALTFRTEGPFGQGLPLDDSNLVIRARDGLLALARRPVAPFALTLEKALPIASGMGGGSSDAAAALRLVGKAVGVSLDDEITLAKALGADVPACLYAASVIAGGRGDVLSDAPGAPPLPAVLVNPGVGVSTRAVFEAFDAGPCGDLFDGGPPEAFETVHDVAAFLARQRNDLQRPAIEAQPIIADAINALAASPEPLLVRMSGSGATVFALCADAAAASRLAVRIAADYPAWWVKACTLT